MSGEGQCGDWQFKQMMSVPSSVLGPLPSRPLQPTQADMGDQVTLASLVLCPALPHLNSVEDVSQVTASLPETPKLTDTRGARMYEATKLPRCLSWQ